MFVLHIHINTFSFFFLFFLNEAASTVYKGSKAVHSEVFYSRLTCVYYKVKAVKLHSAKQNCVTVFSSVENISDHSRVFLCHPFANKAEHTPRHIITNFQRMTHPSSSTIPPLHRPRSSVRPSCSSDEEMPVFFPTFFTSSLTQLKYCSPVQRRRIYP